MDKYKKDMRDMQKNLADAISIWNHAIISLIDIRHSLISPEESIHGYRLPTSTFLYTIGSKAEVVLNDTSYSMERFGLFHGGKGTELSIQPADDWLEYYMILYKVGMPPFHKREYTRLLERINPFRQQYGFTPDNPLFFAEQLRKMYEHWKGSTPLNLFYGKTAFYQLVYEIYEEMDQGSVEVLEPDVVAMAKRYLDEHYHRTISIQSIASLLGISDSHLRRCFKSQYGESPQEYLMKKRLYSAKKLLQNRDSTIRQVAAATGFSDEFNFSRSFMKSFGISPKQYSAKTSNNMSDYIMDFDTSFSYNDNREVSLFKLKEEGANFMIKQMKNKAIVAVALSLMLMLSACGTTSTNTGNSEPTQVTETEVQNMETGTRIINTVMGDVEVPENPQNIVINAYFGDLFALDVMPAGVSTYDNGAAFAGLMDGIDIVDFNNEEAIMALNPDLIIFTGWPNVDDNYEDLSKIAPTIYISAVDMTLEERFSLLGKVLGKEEKVKKILDDFYAKAHEAKEKLKDAGYGSSTFSIFEPNMSGSTIIAGDLWSRGGYILYDLLEMNAPDSVKPLLGNKAEPYAYVSTEVLPEYAGDYIFYSQAYGNEHIYDDNEVWNNIPAVANGRVIPIDGELFYYDDIYSLLEQLNIITDVLIERSSTK